MSDEGLHVAKSDKHKKEHEIHSSYGTPLYACVQVFSIPLHTLQSEVYVANM